MKKLQNIFLFTIIFCGFFGLAVGQASAADHYIRADAAGTADGSNWTNAWTDLPATLTRGDTYYISDGSYGSYYFDDIESGSIYIYVKKATIAAHGTDTGWSDSYGDGQANWPHWSINKGYYVFDGIIGDGNSGSSYGFHLSHSDCGNLPNPDNNNLVDFQYNTSGSFAEFRHIFFEGCGNTEPKCSYGIKSNASSARNNGSIIANNLFYGHAVHLVLYAWDNTIVERNFFDSNWSGTVCHGEQTTFGSGSSNIIYRYNIHRNSATGGLGVHHNNNSNWKVYGNIFYGGRVTMGVIGTADSGPTHPDVIKNWEVYNNTVYNVTGGGFGAGFFQGECTDTAFTSNVYNNIFVNTIHPVFSSTTNSCVNHDYNSFYNCIWLGNGQQNVETESHGHIGTGDPLVDSLNNNFHLKQATNNGLSLLSPFNVDYDGAIRGADDIWDRGAYEYVSSDITPPAAPTGLSVN